MSESKICRLCLTQTESYIDIFSEIGNRLHIASILAQHFWFQVNEFDGLSQNICTRCWTDTGNFHEFYIKIENIQKNYIVTTPQLYTNDDRIKLEPESFVNENSDEKYSEHKEPLFEKVEIIEEKLPERIKVDNSDDDFYFNDYKDSVKSSEESSEDSDNEVKPTIGKKASVSKSKKKVKKDIEEENSSRGDKIRSDNQRIRDFVNMNCDKCDTQFPTFAKALVHYDKIHKTNGYLMCCDTKYIRKDRLLEHIQRHINPNEHRCHPCNKIFVDKYSLKNHIANHEPFESRSYKCNQCPSSFTEKSRLNSHIRHYHKAKEDLICDMCQKHFKSKTSLTYHFRSVHETRNDVLVCEICAKVFTSKHVLRNHQLDHADGPRQQLQCNVCGAWLKNAYNLRKHLKRHADTVQTCTICNKQLLNKHSLVTHIRSVHRERSFKCTLCDKAFKKAVVLKEHMAIHTGEDLYKCSYCPKTFKFNPSLHLHHRKAHHEQWTLNRLKRFEPNHQPKTIIKIT